METPLQEDRPSGLGRTTSGLPAAKSRWRRPVIVTVVLLTLAYYFWTTVVSFDEVPRIHGGGHREGDHHNLLSRGFLKGQLNLDHEVPAALLTAPNPYDPQRRGPVQVLHDASLYRGKYYVYFGPGPVVTLFLPFTVLTGRDLPLPYGVFLFSSGAFLVLSATFLFVQRRHFPSASLWSIIPGLIALGGASMIVALLRRPHIWEISCAAGLFYTSLAIYALVRAIHSPRPIPWTAFGGLVLGLAVASRPTWILCSLLFGLPIVMRARRGSEPDPYDWRALLAAAVSCTAIVAGLLAYNYARFENPFEFGQKYQLSSIIEGDARHFSLSYVAWNFRTYFLTVVNWISSFPFHNGVNLTPLPSGHGGYEYSFGLFPNLPISLFALAIPVLLAHRRCRDLEDKRRRTALAVFTTAAFFSTGLLLCFFGNCVRYMADFTPWLMLMAACCLLAIDTRLSSRGRHVLRTFGLFVITLGLFSTVVAALGIVRIYHITPGPIPGYLPVARALNYPIFALRQARFANWQPQELVVSFPADRTARQEPLVTLRRDGHVTAELFVDYLGQDRLRFGYREAGASAAHFSPAIAPSTDSLQKLHVSLGHVYDDYDGYMSRLRLHVDDWPLWRAPIVSFPAMVGETQLGASADSAPRFTGTLHQARAIAWDAVTPARLGGARVRVTLTRDMAGRSFPLLTSGKYGAGSLLFLQVEADGRTRLGYDQWADRLRSSDYLPTGFDQPHVFEFWMPPFTPAFNDRGDRKVLVRLDGAVVWHEPVPWFPTTADTLFVASNPIGGSTCEAVLVNGIVERTQLPYPTP